MVGQTKDAAVLHISCARRCHHSPGCKAFYITSDEQCHLVQKVNEYKPQDDEQFYIGIYWLFSFWFKIAFIVRYALSEYMLICYPCSYFNHFYTSLVCSMLHNSLPAEMQQNSDLTSALTHDPVTILATAISIIQVWSEFCMAIHHRSLKFAKDDIQHRSFNLKCSELWGNYGSSSGC